MSLALRALEEVGGNKGGVSAADVVDGYRERTVGLLLEMMQRWGLGTLVDFEETQKEVLRLERKVKKRYTAAESQEDSAEVELLKRWAAVVAELHGFKVENLTTSFADGNVFLAIVTEYEQYFPVRHVKGVEETLERKLRALGCNSFFGKLPSVTRGTSTNRSNSRVIWQAYEIHEIRAGVRQRVCHWGTGISLFKAIGCLLQREGKIHLFKSPSSR